jgi:hypothetical protein
MAVAPREESTIWARLNVFDLNQMKNFYESGGAGTNDLIVCLLNGVLSRYGGQLASSLTDPASNTDEGLTHICASGLTAREVVNRIEMIPQKDLRDKLAYTILPYISSPRSDKFQEIFSIQFNLDELDDDKGDIIVEDHSSEKKSSARKIKIYYAKCVLRRENTKYFINVAYYHFDSMVPFGGISSTKATNKTRTKLGSCCGI